MAQITSLRNGSTESNPLRWWCCAGLRQLEEKHSNPENELIKRNIVQDYDDPGSKVSTDIQYLYVGGCESCLVQAVKTPTHPPSPN